MRYLLTAAVFFFLVDGGQRSLLYSDGSVINRIACQPNLTCWVDGGTLHISRAGVLVEPDLIHKVDGNGEDYVEWNCPANSFGVQTQNVDYDEGPAKPICVRQ